MKTKYPNTPKIPFCDNEYCSLHEFEAAPTTEILRNDFISVYSRHKLFNGKHVCSICLNAITIADEEDEK